MNLPFFRFITPAIVPSATTYYELARSAFMHSSVFRTKFPKLVGCIEGVFVAQGAFTMEDGSRESKGLNFQLVLAISLSEMGLIRLGSHVS